MIANIVPDYGPFRLHCTQNILLKTELKIIWYTNSVNDVTGLRSLAHVIAIVTTQEKKI